MGHHQKPLLLGHRRCARPAHPLRRAALRRSRRLQYRSLLATSLATRRVYHRLSQRRPALSLPLPQTQLQARRQWCRPLSQGPPSALQHSPLALQHSPLALRRRESLSSPLQRPLPPRGPASRHHSSLYPRRLSSSVKLPRVRRMRSAQHLCFNTHCPLPRLCRSPSCKVLRRSQSCTLRSPPASSLTLRHLLPTPWICLRSRKP